MDKLIQTEHQAQLQLPNFVFGHLQCSVQTRTKGNQRENPRRPSLILISSQATRTTQTHDIDVDGWSILDCWLGTGRGDESVI
jgi:hypothetical protein